MGQEIVYCNSCQNRLLGSDFDKGKAFRLEHQCLCLDCAQKLLTTLPPAERDAFAARMKGEPKKHSTVKIPTVRSGTDSGSHARMRAVSDPTIPRAPAEPKRSTGLVLGIVGGIAALVVVGIVAVSSSSRPQPPSSGGVPPTPPPPPVADAGRAAEARRQFDQARSWAASNPDDFAGQIERFQKLAWIPDVPAVAEDARRELEASQARQAKRVAKDLADLDARLKPQTDRGEYGAAIRALEAERNRHALQDWTLAIRRKIDAAVVDARSAAAEWRRQAALAKDDPAALRALRDRTAALGLPDLLAEFDAAASSATAPPVPAAPPLVVYDDALARGWHNNSWNSEVDLKAESPVAQGRHSIAWTPKEKFAGLYFGPRGTTVSAAEITAVSFRVYRVQDRTPVNLSIYTEDRNLNVLKPLSQLGLPALGQWKHYVVPLADLDFRAKEIRGVVLQSTEAMTSPLLYVDDVSLLRGSSPPVADAQPPPPTGELAAWRASWLRAAAHAAGRDYAAAEKELADASAALKDAAAKSEAARDLAELKAAGALLAEALAALAKWPRGMNLAVDLLDPAGRRVRVDAPVRRVDGPRLEIRPADGRVDVETGEILASSLAELARAKEPRVAALLCALEGDLDGARRFLGAELPAAWTAAAAALPDGKDARALLLEAAAEWREPATRVQAAGRYAALLRDHASVPLVRRLRPSLAGRAEAPREFFFATSELKTAGLFHPARHPKGEIGWTMAEDATDRARRPENHVEVAYSVAPNAEIHAWVLAGACCLETWSFFVQASDLEGPDPEAPTSIVSAEPGTAGLVPVPVALPFLKRTHASHGGAKAPTRFEWIPLPVLKHAQGGPKRLRLVSDQQGFTVVAVLLSAAKRAAPKEADLRELEAGRPPASALLDAGAAPKIGGILREVWTGLGGDKITDLTGNAAFRGRPQISEIAPSFASPQKWADSYGTRMRGWVVPPATGNYQFFLCTDDDGELWLSTDDNPANRQRIAMQDGASSYGNWTQRGGQQSKEIPLVRGRLYYIEALQKEGGGDDHVLVGWKLPDGSLERPIPGKRLVPWSPANAARLGGATASISVPAALPAGTPAVLGVDVAGVAATRIDVFNGTQRIGEAKGNPPTLTWTAPPLGAHLLSARVTERGGKSTFTPPATLVVGDLFPARLLDLNGPESRDRVTVTGTGWERNDLELRPHADGEHAALLRTTVAAREGTKVEVSGIPDGKALVYLLATELEAAPQAFDVAVNGKPVLSGHRFAAAGDWARLGPWPVDVAGGKVEVAASKGVAHFAGLEIWTQGAPPKPTRRESTEMFGGGGGNPFELNRNGDPLLVGFKITRKDGIVKSLKAVWLEGDRDVESGWHGGPDGAVHDERAKPGYAVAGLQIRGGDRVRALRVIYMRTWGGRLNPADRYESAWLVGDESGTVTLGADGAPAVGIVGGAGGDLDRLGLIFLR
jgi:hypothetical protein